MSYGRNYDEVPAPDSRVIDFIDGKSRPDTELEQIRQNLERTLIEEYRFAKMDVAVDFRVQVQDGTRTVSRKVALVVFRAGGEAKTQDDVSILIQVAKPTVQPSDSKNGASELEKCLIACPNADFACWNNGVETVYFQKKRGKFDTDILPVNDFPRKGEDPSSIFTTDRARLRVATGNNLLSAFKRCHDFIHANQGGSKEQIFWEFLKVLFSKIEDEQHDGRPRFAIRNSDERNTKAGQKEVKDRVEQLFREVRERKEFRALFTDASEGVLFNPDVVAFIVAQLEKYDFLHSSVDVKGVAYETIVGPTLEGTRGEFFTPRNVVKMVVKMLDPSPGQRILDPACGTGGFIVVAFNYISEKLRRELRETWRNQDEPTPQEEKALNEQIHRAGKSIFGLDFNSNLVKTAQMNMVMNNDGRGGLFAINSLWKPAHWPSKEAQELLELGSMDFVLANPPFGTSIKVEGQDVLQQFDVAHAWEFSDGRWRMGATLRAAMPPEVLFIERCIQFLKPGRGKLGIVVPNGLLGTPESEYLRSWVLSQCEVLASVQLPVETFLPRTGTQTSVLVLRRLSDQEKLARSLADTDDHDVFMCSPRSIGKNRRGKTIYIRDDRGLEINRREAYETWRESNLLTFCPTVESTGKVVDDDLWACASQFRHWIENGRGNSGIALHGATSISDIPARCASASVKCAFVRASGFRLNAEAYLSSRHYLRLEETAKETVSLGDIADVFTIYLQSPILAFLDEPREGITQAFYTPSDLQRRNPRKRHVSLVADPRIRELQVSQGWILLSASGTVGQITLVTEELHGAVVGGDMIRVVPKNSNFLGYIYFFLNSTYGEDFFNMRSYGSVVEHLHPEEIQKMKMVKPDGSLLLRLNRTLEQVVQSHRLVRKSEEAGVSEILMTVDQAIR